MDTSKANELQLHSMFEYCTDFVYCMEKVNDDYIYTYVNPATAIVFENGPPIGKTLAETITDVKAYDLIQRHYDEALLERKQVVYRDFNLFSTSGRTSETTVLPLPESNSILAITKEIGILKDLEEENHFLSELFEKQTSSILILDLNLNVIKTNARFDELFAKDGDVIGMAFDEINSLDEEHSIVIKKALEGAKMKRKSEFRFDVDGFYSRDGEIKRFIINISPLLLGNEVVALSMEALDFTKNSELRETLDETSTVLQAYQKALDEAANFCITDLNGIIEHVSSGYLELSQYEHSEELIGKTNAVLNSRQHSQQFYKEMWDTITAGKTWRGEICNRSRIGTHYWVDTTIIPMYKSNGEMTNFLSVCFDVTDKRVMMTNLRNIERTFRLITENTNDFIVITNEDGIVLYVSPNYETRLGYEKEELLGKFYYEVLSEESKILLRSEIDNLIAKNGDSQIELQLLTQEKEPLWIEAHVTSVEDATRDEVYQFVIIAREITKRKQKEDELRFLAYHDSLTLLPNRRYLSIEFSKRVKQAINFEYSIALLYIDGDNFKRINDVYGHDVGDIFIREFANALVKSVRENDIVSRVGGDEFIIMLTHMSLDKEVREKQLLQTIDRLQTVLRKGWMIDGNHFAPTSSIGISSYPVNGQSINELIAHADEALYIAKKINGKDSFHISQVEL